MYCHVTIAIKMFPHLYVESVAVWDLIVDYSLYIDRLQFELYGNVNEPWRKKTQTDDDSEGSIHTCVCVRVCVYVCVICAK